MKYLPPDLKYLEEAYVFHRWEPDTYLWNGFSFNDRTYIMKFGLYLHVGDYDQKSRWAPLHHDEYLPDGVMSACRLWKKNNCSLPLYEYLDQMFGE